ncbi:MAG TPA: 3-isopropylmalate dehydrogenase [Gemmatimonadales bacterium]|nr:3-isopropylmalate dehydrogenase [Gemmatimonadales bacterium]
MSDHRIVILPGDGIGPEVTAEAERVLRAAADRFGVGLAIERHDIGGAAYARTGQVYPRETRDALDGADAVLLGAVGDPSLDRAPREHRPEAALLALRRQMEVYANLRPVRARPALAARSPIRAELLGGVDVLIVRELTGGLYYGEPRGRYGARAVNTLTYEASEVERVARVAFAAAAGRRGKVTSVDKANVLEVSQLWRETVTRVAREHPAVRLDHQYVDVFAMRLVATPAAFDVVLTDNMFGDILSDEAAVLAGSLGLLPSASIGDGAGLFEPIHGSAPDIAGQGIANPIGAILSVAMLLRHGLGLAEPAALVEQAVDRVLAQGLRTADLAAPGEALVSTAEMGSAVAGLVGAEALAGT